MFTEDLIAARQNDDKLKDGKYEREIITSAECSVIEFQTVLFDGCRFIECDFTKSAFYDCKFLHCDLSNCKMPDSYWKNCEIEGCKCNGIDFTKSVFKQTVFKNNSFVYGLFSECDFSGGSFISCDLSNALLSQVKLRRILFNECRLISAELFRTNLKDIDLSNCDISGIVVSDTFQELRGLEVSYSQAAELAVLLGIKIK